MGKKAEKPLGGKAYGSIGHLPGSRRGPGDHGVHEGQARIATGKVRDKRDRVIVQEKLDGSCVAAAKVDGEIVALQRAGYPAESSPYRQHHDWAKWVQKSRERFQHLLDEGERLVGEWLAQAHGTRYDLRHCEPFVAFDIMTGKQRVPFNEFQDRTHDFFTPAVLHDDNEACSIDKAMERLGESGFYGAIDPPEGAVWRVERDGKVDFLAKFVRPGKVDGLYLPSVSGGKEVWNWTPP